MGAVRWILGVGILTACSIGKSAPPPDDGEATFREVCARCHGQDGTGGMPVAPDGVRPRDFTDEAWQHAISDAEIETVIRTGRPPMPAFHGVLTDEQIRAVAARVRRFAGKETRR
jgi:mono/diheme cytochrome c family protein